MHVCLHVYSVSVCIVFVCVCVSLYVCVAINQQSAHKNTHREPSTRLALKWC